MTTGRERQRSGSNIRKRLFSFVWGDLRGGGGMESLTASEVLLGIRLTNAVKKSIYNPLFSNFYNKSKKMGFAIASQFSTNLGAKCDLLCC